MARGQGREREDAIGLPSNARITSEAPGRMRIRLYTKGKGWTVADGVEAITEEVAQRQGAEGVHLEGEIIRTHQRRDGQVSGAFLAITSLSGRRRPSRR